MSEDDALAALTRIFAQADRPYADRMWGSDAWEQMYREQAEQAFLVLKDNPALLLALAPGLEPRIADLRRALAEHDRLVTPQARDFVARSLMGQVRGILTLLGTQEKSL